MNTCKWLLDTNVVFYIQRGLISREKAIGKETFGISVVQIMEILGNKSIGKSEDAQLRNMIRQTMIIPVSEFIAYRAADQAKRFGLRGIDSLIAATAIEYDLTLVSADSAFPRVPGLQFLNPLA